jgi:cytochrome b subunit of formate dehydrogenase
VLYGVWLYFVVMMSAAFGFFGLHSILWFARSLVERIRRGPMHKHNHNGGAKAIKRFNKVDRANHALVIVSFFGLTLTGLPLLFSDHRWAIALMGMLGGVKVAGTLHRIFAVMLISNFVIHGVGLVRRFKRYGIKQMLFGPNTMLPRWKDFTDCLGMWKWFFNGGAKPKFDRWTYWEKFDYVAEVGGSGIIGLSGLLLWFPEFFAQFMPGWIFNVATIVHGYEAMLAIGFIFTIHFFNAHLRMEKFPVDDVMFTGVLPEEEFKHEREAEYERLAASGELEKLRVAPPPRWYRPLAVTAGVLAMAIGTMLVALIVLAGLGWIK